MDGIALFPKAITLFLVLEDGLSPCSLSGLLLRCTRLFGGSERKEPQVPELSRPFSCSGLCSGYFFGRLMFLIVATNCAPQVCNMSS